MEGRGGAGLGVGGGGGRGGMRATATAVALIWPRDGLERGGAAVGGASTAVSVGEKGGDHRWRGAGGQRVDGMGALCGEVGVWRRKVGDSRRSGGAAGGGAAVGRGAAVGGRGARGGCASGGGGWRLKGCWHRDVRSKRGGVEGNKPIFCPLTTRVRDLPPTV
uniref:Uncharacterized protein n=2 Tax=Oryza TaxID=4527 RepID=A0A0D3H2U9_9ORYZ